MATTRIEWTDVTWNPTTGCDKITSGCKFCYAEVMAKRLQGMGVKKYENAFKLTLHEDSLRDPYSWKKPRMVFVNSMSDLFHKDIPLSFLKKVFDVMNDNPHHVFQILTKRADRLMELNNQLEWGHNIWMGVTVEDSKVVQRIDLLRQTKARVKFLSCEPLISAIPGMNLSGIDWVIVGGESGRKPRPIKPDWVLDIKEQCLKANVKFFFKQWGGTNKKKNGRILEGKTYDEMPLPSDALQLVFIKKN
ncbi:MAG: phage Gp37/Gp68 family protein [Ignavibacteria bacterium]|nr:phage Gp37/Gp68 family protein [Ignavibacteria bacterium]